MNDSRAVIIHPDGTVDLLGNRYDKDEMHIFCLLDYADKTYPDASMFQKLSIHHQPEIAAFFLTLLGNVVILNTTSMEEKYGKSGMAFMPSELTEQEINTLYEFAGTIPDYKIDMLYDMNVDSGVLDGQTLYSVESNFKELLDKYTASKSNKKAK